MTTFCGLDYYASDELYQDWKYQYWLETLEDGRPPYEWEDRQEPEEDDWLYQQSKVELDRETALNSPW